MTQLYADAWYTISLFLSSYEVAQLLPVSHATVSISNRIDWRIDTFIGKRFPTRGKIVGLNAWSYDQIDGGLDLNTGVLVTSKGGLRSNSVQYDIEVNESKHISPLKYISVYKIKGIVFVNTFPNLTSLTIWKLPAFVQGAFPRLTTLNVERLDNTYDCFPSLTDLDIYYYKRDISVDFFPNLRSLRIKYIKRNCIFNKGACPKLTTMLIDNLYCSIAQLEHLTSITSLSVYTIMDNIPTGIFPNLTHLTMSEFTNDIDYMTWPNLTNLTNLNIPKYKMIPERFKK